MEIPGPRPEPGVMTAPTDTAARSADTAAARAAVPAPRRSPETSLPLAELERRLEAHLLIARRISL